MLAQIEQETVTDEKKRYASSGLVVQKDKALRSETNKLAMVFAVFSIYSMFFPAVLMDIFIFQYQNIYFRVMGIPALKRSDYVVLDRYNLTKLNVLQKINCIYCEYVNGLVAYAKDVANQTEIYSCAIKHNTPKKGQEHHKDFYEYNDFA